MTLLITKGLCHKLGGLLQEEAWFLLWKAVYFHCVYPSHTGPRALCESLSLWQGSFLTPSGWKIYVLSDHTSFAHVYLFKGGFRDGVRMRSSDED